MYHVFTVDDEVKDRNDEDSLITTNLQEVIDAWMNSREPWNQGRAVDGAFSVHLEVLDDDHKVVYQRDLQLR